MPRTKEEQAEIELQIDLYGKNLEPLTDLEELAFLESVREHAEEFAEWQRDEHDERTDAEYDAMADYFFPDAD